MIKMTMSKIAMGNTMRAINEAFADVVIFGMAISLGFTIRAVVSLGADFVVVSEVDTVVAKIVGSVATSVVGLAISSVVSLIGSVVTASGVVALDVMTSVVMGSVANVEEEVKDSLRKVVW